jgi:hypothetical protein
VTAPLLPVWWPIFDTVRTCLCQNLAATLGGPVGRCCVQPGGAIILDECCDGTAWVRVDRVWLKAAAGTTQVRRDPIGWGGAPCGDQMVMMTLGLGVMRCAATIDERGTPPGCEVLEDESMRMLSDIDALYKTAVCCLEESSESFAIYATEPLLLIPQGPAGGCVGAELSVQYTVELCPCLDRG